MRAIGFLVLLMLVGWRSPEPHGILVEGVRCGEVCPSTERLSPEGLREHE
jgi:hypothetical protein